MANIKSQMKRIKTNELARQRNKAVKSQLRTEIRRVREAVAEGDASKAVDAARVACRSLDVAVRKGVIHANNAANRKSAVTRAANGLVAAA
ncbi:MAG: 30S ribosomal protein S20 [Propionibacteriaceae bacterium]|nr:30S ribosomal protein S20 [Propionibacteriaceae bacterium]